MIRAVAVTTAVYLVLFGAGLSLCLVLSRKIDKQMSGLVQNAAALHGGGEITASERELQEVRKVREAIARAKMELEAREKRQQLLINELNHRVKNSLAPCSLSPVNVSDVKLRPPIRRLTSGLSPSQRLTTSLLAPTGPPLPYASSRLRPWLLNWTASSSWDPSWRSTARRRSVSPWCSMS